MTETATQRMAESVLQRPLKEWVRAQRAEGASWQTVADRLRMRTQGAVHLNRETLRVWYRDDDRRQRVSS